MTRGWGTGLQCQRQLGGADNNREGIQTEGNKGEAPAEDKEEEVQDTENKWGGTWLRGCSGYREGGRKKHTPGD